MISVFVFYQSLVCDALVGFLTILTIFQVHYPRFLALMQLLTSSVSLLKGLFLIL